MIPWRAAARILRSLRIRQTGKPGDVCRLEARETLLSVVKSFGPTCGQEIPSATAMTRRRMIQHYWLARQTEELPGGTPRLG